MKPRKHIGLTLLAILLLSTFACGGGNEDEEVKEVKFGIGLPMGGLYGAALGIPAKQGLELANEYIGEFTVAGERYKWDLLFEDNHWSTEGGVASATKLIFDDGVNIMTQFGCDPSLAARTICEESGVVLFTSALPLDAYGPDKPHTFLGQTFVYGNSAVFFSYVSEAYPEVKTVSLACEDSLTGHVTAEAVVSAAEYYGIEVLDPEYYPPETVEVYPVATKMMRKNPDLCYMDPRVLAAMREMGWKGIPFYTLWHSTWGEEYGKETVEGYLIFYPVPLGEGLPESLTEMAAEYEQRFGAEFMPLSFYYVVQLYFLTDALEKAGTVDDVNLIITTLETENFDTPMGLAKFGLPELDGIGHLFILPCWIGEIRDEEYHVVFEMSTDEVEALVSEVFEK